jgi:hypothetical protein
VRTVGRLGDNDDNSDAEEVRWRTEEGGGDGVGSVGATIMVGGTVTVTAMATARLLLRVGSEEGRDSCARDSLAGWEGFNDSTYVRWWAHGYRRGISNTPGIPKYNDPL